jgi:MbtH protein
MSNPFDTDNISFLVLINDEEQFSLWPQFVAVPSGWTVNYGPENRVNCLSFIESNWQDLTPKSAR